VTFALADSADLMRQLGVDVETVRATGGGARSRLWRSILADVLEARVLPARGESGPAFGAAILAGVGAGVFPSVPEATDRLIELGAEATPEPATSALYARYRALYDSLYPALKSQFSALAELV
jgi:xylulokinase